MKYSVIFRLYFLCRLCLGEKDDLYEFSIILPFHSDSISNYRTKVLEKNNWGWHVEQECRGHYYKGDVCIHIHCCSMGKQLNVE